LTGNMRKHVWSCWGEDMLSAAHDAKDVTEVQMRIVGSILHNGSITAAFERKNKGQVTYSNHQHTLSNKTVAIPNPNAVREAHCNHLWEFRLYLVRANNVHTLGYNSLSGVM